MLNWIEYLFYPLFVAQIVLISVYLPGKMNQHMSHMLEKYPPEQYPRLYPQETAKYVLGQWKYRMANNVIAAIGFVLTALLLFVVNHGSFADDGYISEAWPAFYGLLQFSPLIVLELSASGQLKLMRDSNTSTTRSAELMPRRLFDYVSPVLVASAVVAALGAALFEMSLHDFVWSEDRFKRLAILIFVNSFFLLIGFSLLKGRKPDPYQSAADRTRVVSLNLRSLMFTSISISGFAALQSLDGVYNIDYLDASIMSLYLVVVASLSFGYLLRQQLAADIDFEVYRDAEA